MAPYSLKIKRLEICSKFVTAVFGLHQSDSSNAIMLILDTKVSSLFGCCHGYLKVT